MDDEDRRRRVGDDDNPWLVMLRDDIDTLKDTDDHGDTATKLNGRFYLVFENAEFNAWFRSIDLSWKSHQQPHSGKRQNNYAALHSKNRVRCWQRCKKISVLTKVMFEKNCCKRGLLERFFNY